MKKNRIITMSLREIKKSKISDGLEYTLVVPNNSVSIDTLHYKKVCTGYQHAINQDSIRINAKRIQVIEGNNQTYIIGGDEISFKIDEDYTQFINGGKVYIDDKEITEYTSKEGSTIITLNSDYLKTLYKGEHTIKVTFNNGKYATANFQVKEEEKVSSNEANNQVKDKTVKNPNTSDSVMIYVYLLIISIIGLIGISAYKIKKD